ncbi:hypothetical protein OLV04_08940 [Campylobacter jejuni]|nr:hypothetical protein [Campylobacter jejuni]
MGETFFSHAFLGLKSKNLDMNTLVALGTLSAFVYSFLVYLQIFKEEDLYFSGAMMIISFVLLGKYLESKAKFKAQDYQRILENIDTKKDKKFCLKMKVSKKFQVLLSKVAMYFW